MRDLVLAAVAAREEKVDIGGNALVVRELISAADVTGFLDNTDLGFKLVVRCTFDLEDKPVFTDDDIPALKKAAKQKLAPLLAAVNRVNGLAVEETAKNSEAGPGAG